ncbi:MAG: polyphenol oxidase family protein, partial [Anaerolineales bacterium]|nr:polyphenol oxidase family protein [Anaerolineales bacterium]
METFKIFERFPELHVGIFGKLDACGSNEECAARLGFKKISKLNQVHGNIIHIAEETKGIPDGDGLISAKAGLALSVRWADCQAFAIYAPKQKVIGALHAGWKGMAVNAITKMYEALDASFGVKPEETFVSMAPSLCKQCSDFTDPLHEL